MPSAQNLPRQEILELQIGRVRPCSAPNVEGYGSRLSESLIRAPQVAEPPQSPLGSAGRSGLEEEPSTRPATSPWACVGLSGLLYVGLSGVHFCFLLVGVAPRPAAWARAV